MKRISLMFAIMCFGYNVLAQVQYSSQLLRTANSGNAKAQYNLALCYEEGLGIEIDYDKAYQWYAKSDKNGYAEATYKLGLYMVNGCGCDMNCGLGLMYLRNAASRGSSNAKLLIKELTGNGHAYFGTEISFSIFLDELPEDKIFANEKVLIAAAKTSFVASAYLGLYYYNQQKFSIAVDYLKKAYGMSFDSGGNMRIDINYNDPLGVIDGETSAYPFILYVCDCLGWCHENGLGVEKDLGKAIKFYTSGDELRSGFYPHPAAYNGAIRKAFCYRMLGKIDKYIEILKSISKGSRNASLLLGEAYYIGVGVELDYTKAKYYFENVTEIETFGGEGAYFDEPLVYADSCYRLYEINAKGLGCQKNEEMASIYFKEALKYGSPSAMYDDQKKYELTNK